MQTTYKPRPVRSPYQPHPIQRMKEKATDTQDATHPVRLMLAKLCQARYSLSATFSPDHGTMSALKTPGLVAVTCELRMDGKPIGLGHGSTAISRLNKGIDRALYSCLNGALMSAINSACKTLDVIRLEDAQRQPSEAYRAFADEVSEPATEKQQEYLRQLVRVNVQDERERDGWETRIDELTKAEASEAIAQFKS